MKGITVLEAKKCFLIWYKDLEDFIEDQLNWRPDIQAGEYGQDTYITIDVKDFKTKEDFDLDQAMQEMIAEDGFDYELIGLWLARKELAEPGKYIVTIWW